MRVSASKEAGFESISIETTGRLPPSAVETPATAEFQCWRRRGFGTVSVLFSNLIGPSFNMIGRTIR